MDKEIKDYILKLSGKASLYYQENREKICKQKKEYYLKNQEKLQKIKRIYYQTHKVERAEYNRKYRQSHKEQMKEQKRRYYQLHKEEKKESSRVYRKSHILEGKIYRNANRQRHNILARKYRSTLKGQLDGSMGASIRQSLKGKKAGMHWETLVGYTVKDLIKHLEILFDENMNWDNYGSYWEIDHRKPKSLFKYETAEDPEFKKCWALKNLQPLEKIANIKKSNNYD